MHTSRSDLRQPETRSRCLHLDLQCQHRPPQDTNHDRIEEHRMWYPSQWLLALRYRSNIPGISMNHQAESTFFGFSSIRRTRVPVFQS